MSPVADTVIALDDGSIDDTLERLHLLPLVSTVLTNPKRPTYRGWDDAANRQRLLDACVELRPKWILQLDADERLDEADAVALRAFLETDADPTCAYLLRLYRMIDGRATWDRREHWAGRVFAYRPGQQLPTALLHFVPVPTDIDPKRWRRTTFRIQHLASIDDGARSARLAKYGEADPDRMFQASYDHLIEPPRNVQPWVTRRPDLPPLHHGTSRCSDADRLIVQSPEGITSAPQWITAAARNLNGAAMYALAAPDSQRSPFDRHIDDPARDGDTPGTLASTQPLHCFAVRASLYERFAADHGPDWTEITKAIWAMGYGVGILEGQPGPTGSPSTRNRTLVGSWAVGRIRAQRAIEDVDDLGSTEKVLRRRIGPRPFARDVRYLWSKRPEHLDWRVLVDLASGVTSLGVEHLSATHALWALNDRRHSNGRSNGRGRQRRGNER